MVRALRDAGAFVDDGRLADDVVTARLPDVVLLVIVGVRRAAARAVSDASANVVWDTDKPRHTVKNSIILFIPWVYVSKFMIFWASEK